MSTEELQALAEADAKTAQIMGKVGSFGADIGVAFAGAVAQMAIMNKMQGKDFGFKNLIPGMSKKPKVETPEIDPKSDPKAHQMAPKMHKKVIWSRTKKNTKKRL